MPKPPPCIVVVDEAKETLCGKDSVEDVLVRNSFKLFAAPICTEHLAEHHKFYRRRSQSRRRNGATHSRSARQPGRKVMQQLPFQAP